MTTRIGIRELRQHASRYIKLAREGEPVEITDRGQLAAVLSAPDPETAIREELLANGELLPGSGGLANWKRAPIPADPHTEPPSAVLTRMRDAERTEA
ncbi:MAG: type II toxin-antitoxin system Phd/YefM family antitoxin [Terriglobales bacterium]